MALMTIVERGNKFFQAINPRMEHGRYWVCGINPDDPIVPRKGDEILSEDGHELSLIDGKWDAIRLRIYVLGV